MRVERAAVQEPPDLVSLLIALLAFMVSKDVALLVGPYAAIAVLASAGAALALSGMEEHLGLWRASWFVTVRLLVAIAITISLAEVLQRWIPAMQPRYTLSPIAFAIGWIRDYDQLRASIGALFGRFLSKRIDDGK